MANQSKSASKQNEEKVFGNINKNISISLEEQELVIFFATDSAINKGSRTKPEFDRKLVKMDKENFVRCFASNFTDNGVFVNVHTPETIYRILKNLNEEVVEEYFERQIISATKNSTRQEKKAYVSRLLEKHKILRLNGSLMEVTLEDFVNVPDLENSDKLPDNI